MSFDFRYKTNSIYVVSRVFYRIARIRSSDGEYADAISTLRNVLLRRPTILVRKSRLSTNPNLPATATDKTLPWPVTSQTPTNHVCHWRKARRSLHHKPWRTKTDSIAFLIREALDIVLFSPARLARSARASVKNQWAAHPAVTIVSQLGMSMRLPLVVRFLCASQSQVG